MERMAMEQLMAWKESPYRKPLMLKGVRQVGKTWLLKEFGRRCYDNVAYFNFDENPEYRDFFVTTKDVRRIIPNLAMAGGQEITPGKTLLIFDEVQDCPEVLNSLKYFCENAPEYHVASAGSLLGVTLAKPSSFPVGKVDFINIYPMTFHEFLVANGSANLASYMEQVEEIEPVPDAFFNPLAEKLKMYFITGGMPEVVSRWAETGSVGQVQSTLINIINAYERDFMKHPEPKECPKLARVWNSMPSQLARENKKFLYNVIKKGARAREYEDALEWLVHAALLYKIFRINSPGLPVSAYEDLSAFKIYMADVGVLRRLAKLDPVAFREGNRLFTEFKGALTENFVLQSLIPQFDATPHYWSRLNPSYEVDFVVQRGNDIIPIEVRADTNIKSRSLKKYAETFADRTKLRVRFSMNNLCLDEGVLNIPLFMADQTDRIMGLALAQAKL
ncbi:MAG: ATP-binding protein [Selenomonadaceae bacterium]|nr:ATP-binding protein [Selenomonadaceae bacterium]